MNDLFRELRRLQKEILTSFYQRPTCLWPKLNWPLLEDWQKFPKEEKNLKKLEIPAEDLQETKKEIIVTFDLPGVDKKDIKLKVTEKEIIVKAEKKEELKEKRKGFFHQERAYYGFYRQTTLPAAVKPEKAVAEYKNGVLKVKLPKKEIGVKKKKEIEVKIT